MKIDKLFKKIETFFNMDKSIEEEKIDKKREKILSSLEKKIISMKEKINNTTSTKKIQEKKNELAVLIKIRDDILLEKSK